MLTFDFEDRISREVDRFARRQVPFAGALALTRTAAIVRDEERDALGDHFTIRSTWPRRGIQSTRATKRRLVAEVGTRDEFMARQETGGEKTPRGGKLVGVPVGIRKTPTQRTTRSRWPGAVRRRRRVFEIPLRGGKVAMLRRKGRKGRSSTELLYVLQPAVKVPKRWGFEKRVVRIVHREWARQMARALEHALRTAR